MVGTMAGMFYLAFRDGSAPVQPVTESSLGPASISTPMDAQAVEGIGTLTSSSPEVQTVNKNEAFFDLMLKNGFTPQEINEIARAAKPIYNFRRIYPGQTYKIFRNADGTFASLDFTVDEGRYIEVTSGDGGLSVTEKKFPFDLVIRVASGLITHSLFASLSEQDLPINIGIKLADIFAWDIDFFSQIRKNDYFRVVYEEKQMKGGPDQYGAPGIGRILSAEFNTSGESHYAFLFDSQDGFPDYFDEKGKSLRKQLLRAPLTYSRISSRYSHRRLHPVLHTYRPHLGIDYAAPTGTPVMTTGDGAIMTASRTRANGNYIKVKHNSSYISYYLHLSRFAKGIKAGVRVKQGQVIGYVGATGIATGPHLDYRVKKNGKFVNPLKLKLPPAKPVPADRMEAYNIFVSVKLDRIRQIPIRDPRAEHYAGGMESAPGKDTSTDSRRGDSQSSATD